MSNPTKGAGLFGTFEPKKVKGPPPSKKKRYKDYGNNWEELSNTCLIMAGNVCVDCKKAKAVNAHHIIPVKKGGANELYNLKALCFHCHAKYHPHLGSKKKGKVVKSKKLM